MSAKNSNVTPQDIAAKAADEKLVTTVPAQAEEPNSGDAKKTEEPKLEVLEGGKKSLKDRLAEVAEKAKENKKALIAVSAAVGVATVAFVKYAKRKAEEALVEVEDESGADQPKTDDSAA